MALVLQRETVASVDSSWDLDPEIVSLIEEAYNAAPSLSPCPDVHINTWFADLEREMSDKTRKGRHAEQHVDEDEQSSSRQTRQSSSRSQVSSAGSAAGGSQPVSTEKSVLKAGTSPRKRGKNVTSSSQSGLLPLRRNYQEHLLKVEAEMKRLNPAMPKPAAHTVGWNTNTLHEYLDRSAFRFTEAQMTELKKRAGTPTKAIPDDYAPIFAIYTWEEQLARFNTVQRKADQLEWEESPGVYAAAVPLKFDRALAV